MLRGVWMYGLMDFSRKSECCREVCFSISCTDPFRRGSLKYLYLTSPQYRRSKMPCIAGSPGQPHKPQTPFHVHISLVAQRALYKNTLRPRALSSIWAASHRGAACYTLRDFSVESRRLGCKLLRLVVRWRFVEDRSEVGSDGKGGSKVWGLVMKLSNISVARLVSIGYLV
jgi:hypothetical protein